MSEPSRLRRFFQTIVKIFGALYLNATDLGSLLEAAEILAAKVEGNYAHVVGVNVETALTVSMENFASGIKCWITALLVSPPELVADISSLKAAANGVCVVKSMDLSHFGLPNFASSAGNSHMDESFPMKRGCDFQDNYSRAAQRLSPAKSSLAETAQESLSSGGGTSAKLGAFVNQRGRDALGCVPGVDPPAGVKGKSGFCKSFAETEACSDGDSCYFNHFSLVELKAIRCEEFVRGTCRRGDGCVYNHFLVDGQVKYCKYYARGVKCPYGDACLFNHLGKAELKEVACQPFIRGDCSYGDACVFKHGDAALQKLRFVCKDFSNGYCGRGDSCIFKHEIN